MLVAEETVESVDPALQLPLEPQIERQQIERKQCRKRRRQDTTL